MGVPSSNEWIKSRDSARKEPKEKERPGPLLLFTFSSINDFFLPLHFPGQNLGYLPIRNGSSPPYYLVELSNYTSRRAYFACDSINSRRGATSSPMSMENTRSASAALSMDTRLSSRLSGFMVVSQSWS